MATVIVEHEEAKALVKHGQEAGFLTHDEVALALDELDLDIAEIEDFYYDARRAADRGPR